MGKVIAGLIFFGFFSTPQDEIPCKPVGELECMSQHFGPDYCSWSRDQSKEMCAVP